MYVTYPAPKKAELWVSDIDGGNKVKITSGEYLSTGSWASDNFHLTFVEVGANAGMNAYIIGADGSGLHQLPQIGGMSISTAQWSRDQKSVYVGSVEAVESTLNTWKWNVGDSKAERFVDKCGGPTDADPSGKYLIGSVSLGEGTGIYEVSISDRKCILLLPGVVTADVTFAPDGKSFLYGVVSRGEVTIYRQSWSDGKIIGKPQVALKIPFAFPLWYLGGNAFDFSPDLSTIVYARPGGHADLYLLNQK
jgi:hypothetical protein